MDAQGNVHPNSDMNSGTFVKLVVDALGQQGRYRPILASDKMMAASVAHVPQASPIYQEVVTAYELGWLTKGQAFHPDQPITRGQASVILARALGYGPLLSHPGAVQLKAADASQIPASQVTADALAVTFGLFSLQNGRFNTNGHVTVANAAVAVVQTAVIWAQAFPNPQGPIIYN
ncbi:MAG: S-layer homology domain-containing protein [Alicyclobacillus sp.]|nr:S-layer homology domain-containing protein [Alicyclobacillus sp.]